MKVVQYRLRAGSAARPGRHAHAAGAAGPAGASVSDTNSLIPISRSASRSERGYAGPAVARSTITGPATVWSAPW
jgi:hypothetical protein